MFTLAHITKNDSIISIKLLRDISGQNIFLYTDGEGMVEDFPWKRIELPEVTHQVWEYQGGPYRIIITPDSIQNLNTMYPDNSFEIYDVDVPIEIDLMHYDNDAFNAIKKETTFRRWTIELS